MCGLSGEIRFDGGTPNIDALACVSEVMAPRGPDGHGRWQEGPVVLAHRRLAIIDLSETGAQPMVDEELGLVTVFNGCIYNYRQLRERLLNAGHKLSTRSDTETLVHLYEDDGDRLVDSLRAVLHVARDEVRPVRLRPPQRPQ